MVSYNPLAVAFGYFSAVFVWLDGGAISMTVNVQVNSGINPTFDLLAYHVTYHFLRLDV